MVFTHGVHTTQRLRWPVHSKSSTCLQMQLQYLLIVCLYKTQKKEMGKSTCGKTNNAKMKYFWKWWKTDDELTTRTMNTSNQEYLICEMKISYSYIYSNQLSRSIYGKGNIRSWNWQICVEKWCLPTVYTQWLCTLTSTFQVMYLPTNATAIHPNMSVQDTKERNGKTNNVKMD